MRVGGCMRTRVRMHAWQRMHARVTYGMYACAHVMSVCKGYACMRVCVCVCVRACMHVGVDVCMHVCMHACMRVCMYVCVRLQART